MGYDHIRHALGEKGLVPESDVWELPDESALQTPGHPEQQPQGNRLYTKHPQDKLPGVEGNYLQPEVYDAYLGYIAVTPDSIIAPHTTGVFESVPFEPQTQVSHDHSARPQTGTGDLPPMPDGYMEQR